MHTIRFLLFLVWVQVACGATAPAGWFAFSPQNDPEAGEIGMQDWLEKPAGKHGRVQSRAEQLIYNGKPIQFWGLNLCYGSCAPDKALADKRAAFYPKYGINSVRLHKFADGPGWAGIQSKESATAFEEKALDKMDYQVSRFAQEGIFIKLSAHFGTIKAGPADIKTIPYLEEFGKFEGKDRIAVPHSAIFYSPEIQDLHIAQIVNMLKHRNPYTGKMYAEDPAIAFVEIVNEQSILFYTSMAPLKSSATLRKKTGERFGAWLRKKYGNKDGLIKAWGTKALNGFEKDGFTEPEDLDANTVLPLGNPWYFDPAQLNGAQTYRKQRLLDTMEFLYGLQCEFYERYTKAVRAAGYTGELVGSNWQAGRALSHYANLHSDWLVGTIDRHNYFGGGRRGKQNQAFENGSMLARAGSGSLSSGLQQAFDRPFMLSEWIHVFPNEWGVEGPAIIGAYGMGLQGWDVSYMFQNGDSGGFSKMIGGQAWDVTAPQVLGVFPAVARQVLRGDVTPSDRVAARKVHVPSLFEGNLGFDDQVAQGYDNKELDSATIPARSLAVARNAVQFTPDFQPTENFVMKPHEQNGAIASSTRQLRWVEGKDETSGYFTMNTPGTCAVVGFAEGRQVEFDRVNLNPQSRFGAIYVTAQGRDETLTTSKRWLIVAIARARNTGMKLNAAEDTLIEKGTAPVLLEPVKARLQFTSAPKSIIPLDHDGRRSEKAVQVTGKTWSLDTGRDQTPYYLVEF